MATAQVIQEIVDRVRKEERTILSEIESKEFIKHAGIDVIESRLATSALEAVSMGRDLGFPLVLKIASPDVVHKSDVDGVKVGLKTSRQVTKAYDEIMASVRQKCPKARIDGVSVQKMVRPGVEVIIGMSKDPQFGPVLMFGLGGVFVEVLKDVSFRVVPLAKRDAGEMIREIKGYPLLQGYRGQEPADVSKLENMLLKISDFVEQTPVIKELDLNPVIAYKEGAVAVDARVVLEDAE